MYLLIYLRISTPPALSTSMISGIWTKPMKKTWSNSVFSKSGSSKIVGVT